MASETSSKLVFLWVSWLACFSYHSTAIGENVNGMFVFGSSLVDNGNNNYLPRCLAKANYLPYGMDSPLGATGRFTNGKNVIDLLCDHLNLPLIPPFFDPSTTGPNIVHGVDFASGASGILDHTGLIALEVINLNQQIRNFEEVTLADLRTQLGGKTKESLSNYLFVFGAGNNDYSFNYYLQGLFLKTGLQRFTDNIISTFTGQIKKLYDLGGRKFVLMSANPLGCYPNVLARKLTLRECDQGLNRAAQLFNANLRTLVDKLKQEMPGSNLVFVNSFDIISKIIANPLSRGFNDVTTSCCEVLTLAEGGDGSLCKRGGRTCLDRKSHVFFDGLHPTEAVNIVIAEKAFSSPHKDEVYPINIQQLIQL